MYDNLYSGIISINKMNPKWKNRVNSIPHSTEPGPNCLAIQCEYILLSVCPYFIETFSTGISKIQNIL